MLYEVITDILVVTQDSWSTQPGGSVGSAGWSTDYSFEIEETNFLVNIGLPGYTAGATSSDPSYVTLHNLTTGTDLTFAASATILSDWSQISIDPQTGYLGKFPNDGTGLDLGAVNDILGTDIEFSSVPSYLYLSGLPSATKLYGTLSSNWTVETVPYSDVYLDAADETASGFTGVV